MTDIKQGWEIKKLGDVCEIVNGSTPLRSNKEFWDNGNFPWFTIDDIRNQGRKIRYTKQLVTQAGLKKLKILPVDTILLCCTASIGEYAISEIELTTNQQFNGLIIKDKKKLLPLFLLYFSSTLKDTLSNLSGKATIDFIPISRLKEIEIHLPPLLKQQNIVVILDEAFAAIAIAKANAEQNLKNVNELFESYLQNVIASKKWSKKTLGDVCERVEYGSSSKSKEEGKIAVLRMGNIQNGRFSWEKLVYSDNLDENKKYLLKYNDVLFNRTNSPALVGKTAIYKCEMPAIFELFCP